MRNEKMTYIMCFVKKRLLMDLREQMLKDENNLSNQVKNPQDGLILVPRLS